jgi:RNA polymerase sigma-70 factor (ECF subfamily)
MSGTTSPIAESRYVSSEGDREDRLLRKAVGLAKQGDRAGLHYLYIRYAGDVHRYVLAIVRDHHEAEDITHNVFTKLIDNITLYQPGEVPFGGWIVRVARNSAIDHVRSRRPLPTDEFPRDEGVESPPLGDLLSALGELPREQREVIVLRHIVGLTPTEIASLLGKSESSIHGLHNRGRRTLQASLSDRGAVPAVAVRLPG